MNNKVLLVDDEVNLLQSLRRSFRGRYDLKMAEGGEAAIEILKSDPSIAVLVSDMQMPNVNGLKVLTEARKLTPNTVRIMLTGNIDQQTAVDAVNQGGVFRFVNKPCDPEALAKVIDEAIVHHEQLAAERILLSRTLTATVGLSTDLLALANPQAHGRSSRLRDMAKKLCEQMKFTDRWQLEIAAMLSQIGCLATHNADQNLPPPFSIEWESMLKSQAEASSVMIARIPKLERVAAIIQHQNSDLFPPGFPDADKMYAKILRMLIDFDYMHQSDSATHVVSLMEKHVNRYDRTSFEAFARMMVGDHVLRALPVHQLMTGMVLEDHVLTGSGDILISKGHELTEAIIQRLRNFQRNGLGVQEPITVRCHAKEVVAA